MFSMAENSKGSKEGKLCSHFSRKLSKNLRQRGIGEMPIKVLCLMFTEELKETDQSLKD